MSAIPNTSDEKQAKSPLLARVTFPIPSLLKEYPPRMMNSNKQFLFQLCMDKQTFDSSHVTTFSRWATRSAPQHIPTKSSMNISHTKQVYQYEQPENGAVSWYVNFADAHLFGYYGGPLFAQDEMQVGEHPLCASVREALETHASTFAKHRTSPFSSITGNPAELVPFTISRSSSATPCLVYHIPRLCCVNTAPSSSVPRGLYGNAFASASQQVIAKQTQVLRPPTWSNIVAMEAPKYGSGSYTLSAISSIFSTAYSAFLACRDESCHHTQTEAVVEVHTGNWGCGAYGGNPTIMALIQLLAAHAAGIDHLVYHTLNSTKEYQQATQIYHEWFHAEQRQNSSGDSSSSSSISLYSLFELIQKQHFQWGQSNGT